MTLRGHYDAQGFHPSETPEQHRQRKIAEAEGEIRYYEAQLARWRERLAALNAEAPSSRSVAPRQERKGG